VSSLDYTGPWNVALAPTVPASAVANAAASPKGAFMNKLTIHDADPSRLPALLVGHIERLCALLAPGQVGDLAEIG
jgi:hypothetical protein